MTKKEIREKYGIELIGKEMWVWDDDQEDAFLCFVIYKKPENEFRYDTIDKDRYGDIFKHASDTNPKYKEPKVGDIGYFWDDEESYLCSVLKNIIQDGRPPYYCSLGLWFTNFSKEKQPWMK
jgi:hypothetical protein